MSVQILIFGGIKFNCSIAVCMMWKLFLKENYTSVIWTQKALTMLYVVGFSLFFLAYIVFQYEHFLCSVLIFRVAEILFMFTSEEH